MKLTDVMDRPPQRRVVVKVSKGSGMFKYIFLIVLLYILFRGDPDLLTVFIQWLSKC